MVRRTPLEFRVRAKQLVSMMTLEEKVYQTLFTAPAIDRLGIKAYNWWNEALHGVARAGVATVFPQAIGLAATFDDELVKQVADVISSEARAKFNVQQKYNDTDIYKGLTFWSPNVNIFRDPRWGRGHETYGEDPYLTSRMGVAFVEGMQGDDPKYLKVAACAKHFCVHSGPESLRHKFNAEVSDQDLYETYLPAFKACVQEADVEIIMGAYNRTNGEPCCGSKKLLTDLLRVVWGFDGHVTSDCWAIQDFYMNHMVCDTAVESVAMAMNAGCDLNCGSIYTNLVQAVKDGLVDEKTLDRAVERLLITKFRLGIGPDKLPGAVDEETDAGKVESRADGCVMSTDGVSAKPLDPSEKKLAEYNSIPYTFVDCDDNRELNRKVAEQSIVMLKNEDEILPLDLKKLKTIGVIGPNADNRRALVGNYEGTSSDYVTPLEGIKHFVDDYNSSLGRALWAALVDATNGNPDALDEPMDPVRVLYSEGCHLYKSRTTSLCADNDRVAEIKAVCDNSDVIIACLGLDPGLEGEEGDTGNPDASGDKKDLNLPGLQEEMLKVMVGSGKPVILLLMNGSSLAVNYAKEKCKGILECWYPGAQGGNAIANILFGKVSPSGKLPVTFYKSTEELPAFTDYSMQGRTYRYMTNEPLYPFGFGLSYNDYELTDLALSSDKLTENQPLTLTGTITNHGSFDSAETVQIYITAPQIKNAPKLQLKGLKKIKLAAGETKQFAIDLPYDSFGLYDENGDFAVRDGEYSVLVSNAGPYSGTHLSVTKEPRQ